MKIPILLAALLFLSTSSSRAADVPPNPANPANPVNRIEQPNPLSLKQALADMVTSFHKTEQCFSVESSLRTEHANKKAELTAEFHGRVPPAFSELLWQKTERINRQHKACFQQYEELGKILEQAQSAMRAADSTKPEFKKNKEQIDQLKDKFHKMQPTPKQDAKTPAKRKGKN